jgi:hypothetical protein
LDYGDEWRPERMLKDIQKQMDCELRLVSVRGYPMVFIEIGEYRWQTKDIRFEISDMLKLIGQLDYLLSRKGNSLREKGRRK